MDPDNLVEDEFATSKCLQNWIGISYEITDEEAIPILEEAIADELQLGLKQLPPEYASHFEHTIDDIISKPLEWKQTWFKTIRKQRILHDSTNLIDDQFSHQGALTSWLGLSECPVR